MSAESIARWNAIPLNRPDPGSQEEPILKRARSDDSQSDGDEDDMSLVSRSPSPVDQGQMDVDRNLDKYDELHRGLAREVITVDTRLKSTNKGFAMLAKMGWVEGQALGLSGDGRVDPVPFTVKNDSTGLGKVNQDFRMIETTVSQRRELDSERQTKESEEQRKKREDDAAKKAALVEEISTTLRAFYCALCDKQFKNVAQYDEHTNSYAHHHKARARDMQAAQKLMQGRGSKEDVDKRKEKERKREEKEMRKLAAAAGIKLAKPVAVTSAGASPPSEAAEPTTAFKKSGWAAVTSTPAAGSIVTEQPAREGWATASQPPQPTPQPPRPQPSAPAFSSGGQMSLGSGPTLSQAEGPPRPVPASVSRPGGWSSISQPAAPPNVPPHASSSSALPPPPPIGSEGWTTVAPAPPDTRSQSGWSSMSGPLMPPPLLATETAGSVTTTSPNASASTVVGSTASDAPNLTSTQPRPPKPHRPAPEDKRSSWQNFKKKAFR